MARPYSETLTPQVAHSMFKRGSKQNREKTTLKSEQGGTKVTAYSRWAKIGRQCKKCGKPNHFAKACRTAGMETKR